MNDEYQWLAILGQRTIQHKISCQGVGVHSGTTSKVELCPAPSDTGIVFVIVQQDQCVCEIPANIKYVSSANNMRTVLQHQGYTVETVEHLLAALAAYHIDNIYIKINGSEIPIHSGCADDWCFLIACAGIEYQPGRRRALTVNRPITVTGSNGSYAQLLPNRETIFQYDMDYSHPLIGSKRFGMTFTTENFLRDISRARTFGFYKDLDLVRLHGLAQGANLLNTVVFDEQGIIANTLRWPDEPARHKICDAVGDLCLAGHAIIAKFHGYKSGHSLNHMLVEKMLSDQRNYRLL